MIYSDLHTLSLVSIVSETFDLERVMHTYIVIHFNVRHTGYYILHTTEVLYFQNQMVSSLHYFLLFLSNI